MKRRLNYFWCSKKKSRPDYQYSKLRSSVGRQDLKCTFSHTISEAIWVLLPHTQPMNAYTPAPHSGNLGNYHMSSAGISEKSENW